MSLVPFAVQKPVPSHSGEMEGHYGLVLHVQVGDGSCYGEFSDPNNQASSTWWVAKDGTLEQYVDSDLAAWTEAAGNFTWDSVETEGTPDEPLTDAQIQTLAQLYVWGHNRYGWPYALTDDVNGRGFGWHGMGGADWGGHFGCPGDLRKAQRQQILNIAQGLAPTAPTTPKPQGAPDVKMSAYDPVTGGVWITDENGDLYATLGAPFDHMNLNEHPQWQAGNAESWTANPCVGIEYWGKPGEADGVVFFTRPVSGKGGMAGTPYSSYRFNRDGSVA